MLGALILFGVAMSLYLAPILTLTMSHAEPDTIGILSSVKAVLPSVIGMPGVGIFAVICTYASKTSLAVGPAASEAGFHTTMYHVYCARCRRRMPALRGAYKQQTTRVNPFPCGPTRAEEV
jgi:hypothetical protein